jgi:hypothetical protein
VITVHLVEYAGQPSVTILCTGEGTTPAWGEHDTGDPDVFVADNGSFYTFDEPKATCPECKRKAGKT